MKFVYILSVFILSVVVLSRCKKHDPYLSLNKPTPYALKIPQGFPPMPIPADNPMTVEGVELGRKLFYDEILSGDFTMSCGTCHAPFAAFSDTNRFSKGITGQLGNRQSMPLINLGWNKVFFWDGRATSLEKQILEPVPNPIEMHLKWKDAMYRLNTSPTYPALFAKAFGTCNIDSLLVAKAIAQFLRTMISGNSKYDKSLRGEATLTPSESYGLALFMRDEDEPNGIPGADCFHCHNYPFFQLLNEFHNNGLSTFGTMVDFGRELVTNDKFDKGKFKSPTLRNIELTFPYMHDGRFNTLSEVLDHYSFSIKPSPSLSTLFPSTSIQDGGVQLVGNDKQAVINFLKTLTDYEFINNPAFKDPGE